ncbi:unnamed protein product [Cyclocybe aegerita]|uniref:Uncharacterized protein n=1 Tax=Cyclocybe aegerita TaxID=1973307 RepID=A0A8S0W079_CYCAE|nr:unnamed protein product [Cyclocybe aegerita]
MSDVPPEHYPASRDDRITRTRGLEASSNSNPPTNFAEEGHRLTDASLPNHASQNSICCTIDELGLEEIEGDKMYGQLLAKRLFTRDERDETDPTGSRYIYGPISTLYRSPNE